MMNGQTEHMEDASEAVTPALVLPSLPVNVKELVKVTLHGVDYYLRHWTPPMRNLLGESLLAECGAAVTDEEMDQGTRDAIAEVLDDPDAQAAALALLEERDGRRLAIESGEEMPADELEAMNLRLRQLDRVLSRGSQAYRELKATQLKWHNAFYVLLIRLTLRRWEGLPTPCVLTRGLPSDELLAAIPAADLKPLADQAAALMSLSELHRKN